jgi:hypothetical protein
MLLKRRKYGKNIVYFDDGEATGLGFYFANIFYKIVLLCVCTSTSREIISEL